MVSILRECRGKNCGATYLSYAVFSPVFASSSWTVWRMSSPWCSFSGTFPSQQPPNWRMSLRRIGSCCRRRSPLLRVDEVQQQQSFVAAPQKTIAASQECRAMRGHFRFLPHISCWFGANDVKYGGLNRLKLQYCAGSKRTLNAYYRNVRSLFTLFFLNLSR
jgi:hypothetical protein